MHGKWRRIELIFDDWRQWRIVTSRLHDKELILINSPTSSSEGFLFLSCFHGLNNVTAFFLLIFLNTEHLFFSSLALVAFSRLLFPRAWCSVENTIVYPIKWLNAHQRFLVKRRESFEFIYLNGLSFFSAIYLSYEIVFSVHDLINIGCFSSWAWWLQFYIFGREALIANTWHEESLVVT